MKPVKTGSSLESSLAYQFIWCPIIEENKKGHLSIYLVYLYIIMYILDRCHILTHNVTFSFIVLYSIATLNFIRKPFMSEIADMCVCVCGGGGVEG